MTFLIDVRTLRHALFPLLSIDPLLDLQLVQLHQFFTYLYQTVTQHELPLWPHQNIPDLHITLYQSQYISNYTDGRLCIQRLVFDSLHGYSACLM